MTRISVSATRDAPADPGGTRAATARPGSDDILVFELIDGGFTLVGGSGRGAGWAGIVQLLPADEALVGRSWRRGTAERLAASRPVQVAGPYYATNAVAVPVGQRHVVVFGSRQPLAQRDSELVQLAAKTVDGLDAVSADKLLTDELEVVQAVRTLMAYRPENVRDTVRHIATVAAQALSCEVAVIRVEVGDETHVEGLDLRSKSALSRPDVDGHLGTLVGAATHTVEQVAEPHPDVFGVEVASRLLLPLPGESRGALALGHTLGHARGFTSLCQRIGRAIADAAEMLISQANTREQLAAERDLLVRMVRTDPLTGIGNRRAWDDEIAAWRSARTIDPAYLITLDIDGLKMVNDKFGHSAGDALIRGAAHLLRSCVRDGDMVARLGGDEFVVLLTHADEATARRVIRRIRDAMRSWRLTEHGLVPRMSMGTSPVVEGDLDGARAAADKSMYSNRNRRRTASDPSLTLPQRRAAEVIAGHGTLA